MSLPKGEHRRLHPEEDDWNLPGQGEVLHCTRGGGHGRPDVEMMGRRKAHDMETVVLSPDSSQEPPSSDDDSSEEETATKKPKH
jgi:hypothetical protein